MSFYLNLFEFSVMRAAYYINCSIVITDCELGSVHIQIITVNILPMLCPYLEIVCPHIPYAQHLRISIYEFLWIFWKSNIFHGTWSFQYFLQQSSRKCIIDTNSVIALMHDKVLAIGRQFQKSRRTIEFHRKYWTSNISVINSNNIIERSN